MVLPIYCSKDRYFNVRGYIRPRNPKFIPTKEDLGKCVDFILSQYILPHQAIPCIRQRMIDDFHEQITNQVNLQ